MFQEFQSAMSALVRFLDYGSWGHLFFLVAIPLVGYREAWARANLMKAFHLSQVMEPQHRSQMCNQYNHLVKHLQHPIGYCAPLAIIALIPYVQVLIFVGLCLNLFKHQHRIDAVKKADQWQGKES